MILPNDKEDWQMSGVSTVKMTKMCLLWRSLFWEPLWSLAHYEHNMFVGCWWIGFSKMLRGMTPHILRVSISPYRIPNIKHETAKLRRSTRWRVYDFWGSILNLFPILGIHSIKVRMDWTNFLGIHSVSKGRHRVDCHFGDPPGSPFSGSIHEG